MKTITALITNIPEDCAVLLLRKGWRRPLGVPLQTVTKIAPTSLGADILKVTKDDYVKHLRVCCPNLSNV